MRWKATVLTLFPEMHPGPLGFSLAGKALSEGAWELETIDIRDFAQDKHRSVDDTPAGGGAGMVMRADVAAAAIDAARTNAPAGTATIYLSPRGTPLTQAGAEMLAHGPGVILLCGRFEYCDRRLKGLLVSPDAVVANRIGIDHIDQPGVCLTTRLRPRHHKKGLMILRVFHVMHVAKVIYVVWRDHGIIQLRPGQAQIGITKIPLNLKDNTLESNREYERMNRARCRVAALRRWHWDPEEWLPETTAAASR